MIFANIMQDKTRFKMFWERVLRKYRFVIMTSDSFEEKLSIRLSKLNILALGGFVVFFCFLIAILLVTSTPLSEYVPGKSKQEVQKELIILKTKSDSLLNTLESQDFYLQNIRKIFAEEELSTPEINESNEKFNANLVFKKSNEDSILRAVVESEEKGMIQKNTKKNTELIVFYPPIKGVVTDPFNPNAKHFGIDLVAKEKTKISAVLSGTVVVSDWTSKTGYVIGIQHKNNFFSLYKHNSILLKSTGDFVKAGEPIAIIGNSGELSSGPHLHFELWRLGAPVNPEDYILF
tara:strand:+ start:813 stop:1685 length:873 start_codon:yes stop_codon:yes gene_type:complete